MPMPIRSNPSTAPLDGGDSLIIFPEGTRNLDDEVKLLPFKSGIYHLSLAHPEVEWCRSGWPTSTGSCPRAACCRCRCSAP